MRLIDADALLERFNEKYDIATTIIDEEISVRFHKFCVIADALEDCPTVDAVPVVRCKDCIHWCEELAGKGWCDVAYGETTHALFFCGAGAKMDEVTPNE